MIQSKHNNNTGKNERYDDVLEKLIEDAQELNDKTKKEIEFASKEIEKGNCIKHENLAKEMGFQF